MTETASHLGLQHAALLVFDLPRALAFYTRTLGFQPYHTVSRDWAMVSRGATSVSLVPGKQPGKQDDKQVTATAHQAVHPSHLGLIFASSDEVSTYYETLLAQNVPALTPPKHHRDGSYGFYFQDTEENDLEAIFIPVSAARQNLQDVSRVGAVLIIQRDPHGKDAVAILEKQLKEHGPHWAWRLAYIESTSSSISEAVTELIQAGATQEIHFVPQGGGDAVADALATCAKTHPQTRFRLWPPLGEHPLVKYAFVTAAVSQISNVYLKKAP